MRLLHLLDEINYERKIYTNNDIKMLVQSIIDYKLNYSSNNFNFTKVIFTSTINTTEFQSFKQELEDSKLFVKIFHVSRDPENKTRITISTSKIEDVVEPEPKKSPWRRIEPQSTIRASSRGQNHNVGLTADIDRLLYEQLTTRGTPTNVARSAGVPTDGVIIGDHEVLHL